MKYENWTIGGNIVKEDDRYVVMDNTELKNLVLSSTRLNPGKNTSGHRHVGQEEVYMFISGAGKMIIDSDSFHEFTVKAGDVVLIPDGAFHQVRAGPEGCYFICVFDGRRHS